MFVYVFKSRYFGRVMHQFTQSKVKLTKDPSYLNKRAEERFMIHSESRGDLNEAIGNIATLISNYCQTQNTSSTKNNKAPPPLDNLIL